MDRFDWIEVKDTHPNTAQVSESLDESDSFHYAQEMRAAGHFRSAVIHYEQAVDLNAGNHQAWLELIDTLVRGRQLDRAEHMSSKALSLYPERAELYASRALVLLHHKKVEEAKIELERGYVIGDRSWYLSCIQAEIILTDNIGYSKEALKSLEKATLYADSNWEAYFIGGWILLDAGLPTWAAGYFAEAGHRNPTAPIVWLCLGDAFKDLRLYDQAMFYYQKATELEPNHQLAIKRQRNCMPKLYGLMRIFGRDSLKRKWDKEFNKQIKPE